MSTENPYIAPLAIDDDRALPTNAHELLALRQRYVYREMTFRAWGAAKLLLGWCVILPLLLELLVDTRKQTFSQRDVYITFVVLTAASLIYFTPGLGLLLLRRWGQWWQILLSLLYMLLGLSLLTWASLHAGEFAFGGLLMLSINGSLLYLLVSSSTRVVLSARYRNAVEITSVTQVAWPMLAKTAAFFVVESVLIAAIILIVVLSGPTNIPD